jgi:hypothetical protein
MKSTHDQYPGIFAYVRPTMYNTVQHQTRQYARDHSSKTDRQTPKRRGGFFSDQSLAVFYLCLYFLRDLIVVGWPWGVQTNAPITIIQKSSELALRAKVPKHPFKLSMFLSKIAESIKLWHEIHVVSVVSGGVSIFQKGSDSCICVCKPLPKSFCLHIFTLHG